MRSVYFDCYMGISGDMTLGALVDAGAPFSRLRRELEKLNVSGYTISARKVGKTGVAATRVSVRMKKSEPQPHRRYPDIVRIIKSSGLDSGVKKKSLAVFKTLAEAEARVHGVPVNRVHFHEVGAVDSIVDIVGAAILLEALGVDRVFASPVNTGSGVVKTEHGVLPVPAPATALMLRDIPNYAEGPEKELTTPTGAAILKTFSESFGPRPLMITETVGNGAGGHDFDDRPNILRAFLGKTGSGKSAVLEERLLEVVTNIDDMSPQALGPLLESLMGAGALDVTVAPVQMKKGRPGYVITVLCRPESCADMEMILFRETTTLGVRRREVSRVSLQRKRGSVRTEYGAVEVKTAMLPGGGERSMPEFESVRKTAKRRGAPFDSVYRAARRAAENGKKTRKRG